ncbi:hypothetical protein [Anoxynatronum sibiricum]|uniref:Uncharacterized protein n=1 Tax=Anoxynatronum sibiricum TaxID=210623 RepID=A0ABU9VXZ6_9CLOT
MNIEFAAIPGSGKTYLMNELYKYLKNNLNEKEYSIFTYKDIDDIKSTENKHKRFRRIHLIKNFIMLLDIHIIKLIYMYAKKKEPIKIKLKSISYIMHMLWNQKIVNQIENNSRKKNIFILDENLFHLSNFYLEKDQDEKISGKYFYLLEKAKKIRYEKNSNLYVLIDSDRMENYHRMNKRNQGWPSIWKNLSNEDKKNVLVESQERYETLKRYVNDSGIIYTTINNEVFREKYEDEFEKIIKKMEMILMKR